MGNTSPTAPLAIRLATPDDIDIINHLDSFSTSPTRDIHREMQKYFGSVDPSTHERTLIFLAEIDGTPVGKAELMLPPVDSSSTSSSTGYVKRVVVQPDYRGSGVARHLMEHIIQYARSEHGLDAIDLHVWEGNTPAIGLYESLGFQLQHRELYFRLPL
jgi:ribosomal protein S18 acetylase RimI-like enzyme